VRAAAHRADDHDGAGHATRAVADLAAEQGRAEEAYALTDEIVQGLEQLGDDRALVHGQVHLAWFAAWRGRHDLVRAYTRRGRQLLRAMEARGGEPDRHAEAGMLYALGISARELGEPQQAILLLERTLSLSRDLGEPSWEAATLQSLAIVHLQAGRYDDAMASCQQGVELLRRVGDRLGEAYLLGSLARVRAAVDRHREALDLLGHALATFERLGDRHGQALALWSMATSHQALGRDEDALDCLRRCLPTFQQFHATPWVARTLRDLGVVYARRGQHGEAATVWRQSLDLSRRLGLPEADQVAGLLAQGA
jgi:tetratricopeptide (TPR) repeat protein